MLRSSALLDEVYEPDSDEHAYYADNIGDTLRVDTRSGEYITRA